MAILLTDDQLKAIDVEGNSPHQLIDPRTNEAFFLVSGWEFDLIRENIEDAREQNAFRRVALQNAGRRMSE